MGIIWFVTGTNLKHSIHLIYIHVPNYVISVKSLLQLITADETVTARPQYLSFYNTNNKLLQDE